MFIHTQLTALTTVEVCTKNGKHSSLDERDPDAWTLLVTTEVQGQGVGKPTTLPEGTLQLKMKPEETLLLYVALQTKDIFCLWGWCVCVGCVSRRNEDLEFLTGVTSGYRFGNTYWPRVWNGGVDYYVLV